MLNLVKIREKSQILLGILLFFFLLSMTAGGLVGGANIMDIILDTGSSNGRFVGKVGDKKISRQEFEKEISTFIGQIEMLCESALEDADLKPADINQIILAGGSTRIPCVRECIKRFLAKTQNHLIIQMN